MERAIRVLNPPGVNFLRTTGLAVAVTSLAACAGLSSSVNLLGGREKCWSDVEPHMATLMKGELELGAFPWHLATPEGETFEIDFAGVSLDSTSTKVVSADGRTLATEGELVTVFGGLDATGVILVCGIEERHTA